MTAGGLPALSKPLPTAAYLTAKPLGSTQVQHTATEPQLHCCPPAPVQPKLSPPRQSRDGLCSTAGSTQPSLHQLPSCSHQRLAQPLLTSHLSAVIRSWLEVREFISYSLEKEAAAIVTGKELR